VRVEGHHRRWDPGDESALEQVLRFRDGLGGGQFWLAHDDGSYPAIAIRISGELADVHYFPFEGHPGYRAQASPSASQGPGGQSVVLIYEGCDPSTGEESPVEFIVPIDTAIGLAREFHRTGTRPQGAAWFEL
jgi:hypothetical protein